MTSNAAAAMPSQNRVSFNRKEGTNKLPPMMKDRASSLAKINTDQGNEKTASTSLIAPSGSPPSSPASTLFRKAIVGDIFGSSMSGNRSLPGLMYRSRISEPADKVVHQKNGDEKLDGESSAVDSNVSMIEIADSDSGSDTEFAALKRMNPKQQLAMTIKNWTVQPENDRHIISEGAVYALIALAVIDDPMIRRCCASSFYHLSSREANRRELLSIGTTTGIITLAMQSRSWKVAKLCALTICYLSMEEDGEATMANEGGILALVVLLGVKGQVLMPVCVQALYNLTCARDHFKGLERIIKALLSIVNSHGFDPSEMLVKSLVNCARYSWLRLRIIEDGALTFLNSLISSLYTRNNAREIVFHMLVSLRSLSDSVGCRTDMLTKGSVEMLPPLLPFIDEHGRTLVVKIMHNFLQSSSAMSLNSFETSVQLVMDIVEQTHDPIILQYCSACIHIFTKENLRGMKHLAVMVIDIMPRLLQLSDALTQFFVISTCGNLFFNSLCDDQSRIEQLVHHFVEHGPSITDAGASQALALALAKLSQEPSYMSVIAKLNLFRSVLELLMVLIDLHKNSLLLQESCCIAICRISLKLDGVPQEDKQRIATVFIKMLETDDQYVLGNTISGIRALGSSGLCPKELLSATLLQRVARIIAKYNKEVELCRMGCAVLAVFSYYDEAHPVLADVQIMNVLLNNIRAEDGITRETVATTLCNISVNRESGTIMITMGVVEMLAALSNSTSETILELCAKCICNLTCNVDLHEMMIQNKVLDILLMISLVRSVTNSTKIICAKALLNMVSDENLSAIKASGAVRVFASLSTTNNLPIQNVCAKGYYLFTLNLTRREELVQRRPILQALYNMVKCNSSRIRIKVGTSVCNLLSCRATCKAAIRAGALSVIKIIATMDFEELREATARVIINLAQDPELQSVLLQEPIVPILVLILQQSADYTFECAIFALSCLSQSKAFKATLIEKDSVSALIGTIIAGKVATPVIAEEICRCICHLSYYFDKAEAMVASGNLLLALQAIYLSGICNADAALLIILILRNLSEALASRHYIIEQDGFKLIVSIVNDITLSGYDCSVLYAAVVNFIYNCSLVEGLRDALVSQGLMVMMKRICLHTPRRSHKSEMRILQKFQLDGTAEEEYGRMSIDGDGPASSPWEDGGGGVVERPTLLAAKHSNSIVKFATSASKARGDDGVKSRSFSSLMDPERSSVDFKFRDGGDTGSVNSGDGNSVDDAGSPGGAENSPQGSVPSELGGPKIALRFTQREVEFIAKIINLLSQSSSCHQIIVEDGVIEIFKTVIQGLSEESKTEIACALANLASSKHCRAPLVQHGATELLIALSVTSDASTKAHCALALGYISELTKVENGVVASLLLLAMKTEEVDVQKVKSNLIAGTLKGADGISSSASAVVTASSSDADKVIQGLIETTQGGASASGKVASAVSVGGVVAAANNNSGNNSLFAMIRDLMSDKRQFDIFIDDLHSKNSNNLRRNSFAPLEPNSPKKRKHVRLFIDERHGSLLRKEEAAILLCSFEKYMYDSSSTSMRLYEPEVGGMAGKLVIELPLPGIPHNRDLEPLDRHEEVEKLYFNEKPLMKECAVPIVLDNQTRPHNDASANNIGASSGESGDTGSSGGRPGPLSIGRAHSGRGPANEVNDTDGDRNVRFTQKDRSNSTAANNEDAVSVSSASASSTNVPGDAANTNGSGSRRKSSLMRQRSLGASLQIKKMKSPVSSGDDANASIGGQPNGAWSKK